MKIAVIEDDLSIKSGSRRLIYHSTRHLQSLGHDVKIYARKLDKTTCFPDMLAMPVELVAGKDSSADKFLKRVSGKNVGYYWSYADGALGTSRRIANWGPDAVIFHYTGEFWLPPYFYYLEEPIGVVCFHVIPRGVSPFPRLTMTGKVGQAIFDLPPIRKKNVRSQSRIGMVITHSSFMHEQVVKIAGRVAAATKHVIPLGVDHSEFFPTDEEEPFVLYLGRIHPQKGLELLIQAMEKTNPRYSLVLAGDLARDLIWYKEKVLALAEKAGLSDRVSVLEAPTQTQLVGLMQRCTAFLFPSTVDTFGLVVLEAMACGKPVVACRAGGVPELVNDSGILLDADAGQWQKALTTLLSDLKLRRKLGEKALERSKRYSWENTTNSLLRALEDFLSRR